MTAGAVGETAGVLREKIVAIAAHHLEAAEADIELARRPRQRARHAVGGDHARRDRGDRVLPAARAAAGHAGRARGERPLHRAQPRSLWANATHVCTCEVDVVDRAR